MDSRHPEVRARANLEGGLGPSFEGRFAAAFATMDVATLAQKLEAADIAFGRVNDVAGLIQHPHLRRIEVETPSGPVSYPAPAPIRDESRSYGRVPKLGEHTEMVRREFG